jgi:hypothetical protein
VELKGELSKILIEDLLLIEKHAPSIGKIFKIIKE